MERQTGGHCSSSVLREQWSKAREMQRTCGSEMDIKGQKPPGLLVDDMTVHYLYSDTLKVFRPHLWRGVVKTDERPLTGRCD